MSVTINPIVVTIRPTEVLRELEAQIIEFSVECIVEVLDLLIDPQGVLIESIEVDVLLLHTRLEISEPRIIHHESLLRLFSEYTVVGHAASTGKHVACRRPSWGFIALMRKSRDSRGSTRGDRRAKTATRRRVSVL
jgi:hypothetical protein